MENNTVKAVSNEADFLHFSKNRVVELLFCFVFPAFFDAGILLRDHLPFYAPLETKWTKESAYPD